MGVYIREPINGLTHLFGAVLSFFGLLALVIKATATTESFLAITAVIIFGISMTLLYAASATYHMVIARDKVIAFLRRIDHSMIYVLIAGTYTPFCLISLKGSLGWTLFAIVSTLALLGVVFKLVWFHSPRWLSTALYIGMGWIVVFFSSALAPIINTAGMIFLILGGIFYTVGGIIYGLKPKVLSFRHMGFHEIFHIFILIGSLFHFICVYGYVL
ncbi:MULTISPECIES: PAQR family membrane homeostasis protein TrhA [Virgibacillus]|uniref:Hemolysin n=2 Tax=Virgibacillus TaxID=84406 RepID=A0A024QA23_9BACI|nr:MULTISPECIES: hemolysin III family protein [Virgibacillus]EQB37385.1 hemolysin [Virgibacillus sp. CM-4]MYL40137.1 hemolysin III family protein [Virgibacillus massiliensis]GGJ61308.1 hemolysin III [Virgibacillus kapii]CDQ39117.1 hemolysin [Virgibacillus massiliensis]